MIRRPSVDEYFIIMAMHASSRGSCIRRRVGCILVDEDRHVLSTGYNGPAVGLPNCTDTPCAGAKAPSGTGLHLCQATHAEHNALLQCANVFRIKTAYCTASPCVGCIQKLLQTPCKEIVFLQEYPHPEALDEWADHGRVAKSIYDQIDANSPVHFFANIYGFGR